MVDLEQALVNEFAECERNPLASAMLAFPWGEGEFKGSAGPRQWQREILGYIGNHLKAPESRFQPCQVAVSSGHGIGKSALVAMLIHWALSTAPDAKILITANTATQLDTKTVPEVSKWFRHALNAHWWDVKATSIKLRGKDDAAKVWRADFTPWSEVNTDAFQGLHNKGKRILLIFDEASSIADKIWEVAEGALTDEGTEIIWLAFGNPTRNTGRFRECFGRFKHRWKTFQIDSRTVEGTNKAQLDKWVEDYGEDSDFVRVRVRGEFPRAGASQFIPSDVVAAARKYRAEGYESLPKIGACDVARFGDDQTVIGDRQGRKARIIAKYRGLDTVQTAHKCMEYIDKEQPDAFVVDGDGLGAGVVDTLNHAGYGHRTMIVEFHGGRPANDSAAYYNMRAEVWGKTRDWLLSGCEIPDDPELDADLTSPQYGFSAKQQVQLEKKEDMKKRGIASPDCADMLAMTFGANVVKRPATPAPNYQQYGSNSWMA